MLRDTRLPEWKTFDGKEFHLADVRMTKTRAVEQVEDWKEIDAREKRKSRGKRKTKTYYRTVKGKNYWGNYVRKEG